LELVAQVQLVVRVTVQVVAIAFLILLHHTAVAQELVAVTVFLAVLAAVLVEPLALLVERQRRQIQAAQLVMETLVELVLVHLLTELVAAAELAVLAVTQTAAFLLLAVSDFLVQRFQHLTQ
jgi:hypothetical protein